jgi:hypothetical protein
MSLAHLYIVIGAVSFVASVLTTIVLVTKFVNQPAAHGFFSYSDTIARLDFVYNVSFIEQVSISPTFFKHFFHLKVKRAAFLYLSLGSIFLGARKLAQMLHIKCW